MNEELREENSLSFANQLWSRESKINNITGKTYIDGFIWHGADYGATTMIEKDLTKAFGDVQIRGYVSKASDLKKMSIPDGYEWVKDDEGVFSLRAANCYVVYHSNDTEGSMDEETIKEAKGGDGDRGDDLGGDEGTHCG